MHSVMTTAAVPNARRPRGGHPPRAVSPRLWLLLVLTLLAGCAVQPPLPDEPPQQLLEERINGLLALSDWRTSGRVGITTAEDSVTMSMDWEQRGEAWMLDLRGPLGTGSVRMRGDAGNVVLRGSDGAVDEAADAQELLYRQTGLDMPVDVLRDWLRGIPSTEHDATLEIDDFGRLTELEQLGWQVQYTSYRRVGGIDMPVRMQMDGPGIRLRASLRTWDFDPD